MNLNDTLKEFEAVEANLAKLDRLWAEISPLLPEPNGMAVSDPEKYLLLMRSFSNVLKVMPKIDGFELKNCLIHPAEIVSGNIDCLQLGEIEETLGFNRYINSQGEILADYRFRMESKRRILARHAVETFATQMDELLPKLRPVADGLQSHEAMPLEVFDAIRTLFKSIEALLGNSVGRAPQWNDMTRHLRFGKRCDYEDIVVHDWPDIRQWLERALYGESDPLPVTAADLGELVRANPQGPVSTELKWANLSPTDFERLIFNLISRTNGYVNPRWLTHTNAPDRGRDLSVDRVVQDSLLGTRTMRIIIACKNTPSIGIQVMGTLKSQMKLWSPPRVDELIVVTSGRFTTDAIGFVEQHNQGDEALRIEMWSGSHLEHLLANRPELIAEFQLR